MTDDVIDTAKKSTWADYIDPMEDSFRWFYPNTQKLNIEGGVPRWSFQLHGTYWGRVQYWCKKEFGAPGEYRSRWVLHGDRVKFRDLSDAMYFRLYWDAAFH